MTKQKSMWLFIVAVFVVTLTGGAMGWAAEGTNPNIIPQPTIMKPGKGTFTLIPSAVIAVKTEGELLAIGNQLSDCINRTTGIILPIRSAGTAPKGSIALALDPSLKRLGDEGYLLKVAPNGVTVTAFKPAGVFYGVQTLRQMLETGGKAPARIPCLSIEDKPQYAWRGMMLDSCRHFMSVDIVKKYIDLLAYHKMNIFHWHLTDDQGWRLEIRKYPLLTEVGAWRNECGGRHGGFYTQEQVRDIVAYAKSRYVMVVPEIEIPGHSVAALAAYPEFSCFGKSMAVETNWGIFRDVFCPGKEKTLIFLEDVLSEVCELFPSPYIHIGGDEVPKYNWERCPDCQKRINDLGIKNEDELQGYVTRRMEQFLASKGRTTIGWDEVLEGGVSRNTIVQSWRGMDGAIEASKMGNRVISSPVDYTYFYCPQVREEVRTTTETINTLERVYSFEPVPAGLTAEQAAVIMGGECCMWDEYTWEFEVDPQMFPRMCAMSETFWTPKEKRNYADFSKRLQTHYARLDLNGVDYYKPETSIGSWTENQVNSNFLQLAWDVTPQVTKNGIYRVSLVQEKGDKEIYIQWAALFQGDREVARYTRFARSQFEMYLKYPLRVADFKPGVPYTLRVSVAGKRDNDTAGSVFLRYFKDTGVSIP